MKKLFIIIFIFSIAVFGQNPNLGTSGAQFLQIPVGAKNSSMGGAVVGLTNDVSSSFWNPAGLVKIKNFEAHFSYLNWFKFFSHNAAAIAYNAGEAGVIGVHMVAFSSDKMEVTTEEQPNGTGRFFDAMDMALGVSYARYLTDRFSVGLSAKYIYQRIWNETANGFAFDIGTQYRLDFQNLTIAMSMSNFGGDMKFDGPDLDVQHSPGNNFPTSRITPARLETEDYSLPLNFQVGIGFDIYQQEFVKIRGAVDAVHPNDNAERLHFGTEVSFFDRLFLRAGYKYNYDDEDIALGGGVNVPFGNSFLNFDYGYAMFDLLPDVHRVSLTVSF